MTNFSRYDAELKLREVNVKLGIPFYESYATPRSKTHGIVIKQHNNTWMRKRESAWLISVEYIWQGKKIFKHTEPWVNFPSDELVAKMALLPREVREESNV